VDGAGAGGRAGPLGAQHAARRPWRIQGLAFTPTTMVTYRANFLGGTFQRIEGVET
jgi:hypothetical protein